MQAETQAPKLSAALHHPRRAGDASAFNRLFDVTRPTTCSVKDGADSARASIEGWEFGSPSSRPIARRSPPRALWQTLISNNSRTSSRCQNDDLLFLNGCPVSLLAGLDWEECLRWRHVPTEEFARAYGIVCLGDTTLATYCAHGSPRGIPPRPRRHSEMRLSPLPSAGFPFSSTPSAPDQSYTSARKGETEQRYPRASVGRFYDGISSAERRWTS